MSNVRQRSRRRVGLVGSILLLAGHTVWNGVLQGREPTEHERLQRGWHIIHGGDPDAGAELLAAAAVELAFRGDVQGARQPAEAALDILDRQGAAPWRLLLLHSVLMLAGYHHDIRIIDRHADRFWA